MAMLAEPKRKQKFGPDPRNTFWSNDETKFGFRMLENMGWKKGKGLGAQENGRTDHVKAVFRQTADVRGVGCSKKYDDNWLDHQDDFNSLLSALNNGSDNPENSSDSTEPPAKSISLEEKSRSSRSRVHYQKFTRGKDLSSRSSQDLDCIFGKRKSGPPDNTSPLTQSKENSDEEDAEERPSFSLATCTPTSSVNNDGGVDVNRHGIKTVTSTSSVQEYFAMKMAELQQKRAAAVSGDTPQAEKPSEAVEQTVPLSSESDPKPKKKKKKSKRQHEEESRAGEVGEGGGSGCVEEEGLKPKKKKKKKKKETECGIAMESCDVINEQHPESETCGKKKKKNNGVSDCDIAMESSDVISEQHPEFESCGKKKKKKNNGVSDCDIAMESSDVISEQHPEFESCGKKKKKKKTSKDTDVLLQSDSLEESLDHQHHDSTSESSRKKKKKKKKKRKEADEPCNSSILRLNNDGKERHRKSVSFCAGGDEIFIISPKQKVKGQVKRKREETDDQEEEDFQESRPEREEAVDQDEADPPRDKSGNEDEEAAPLQSRNPTKHKRKKQKKEKDSVKNVCDSTEEVVSSERDSTMLDVTSGTQSPATPPGRNASVKSAHWNESSLRSDKKQGTPDRNLVHNVCQSFIGSNLYRIAGYGIHQ